MKKLETVEEFARSIGWNNKGKEEALEFLLKAVRQHMKTIGKKPAKTEKEMLEWMRSAPSDYSVIHRLADMLGYDPKQFYTDQKKWLAREESASFFLENQVKSMKKLKVEDDDEFEVSNRPVFTEHDAVIRLTKGNIGSNPFVFDHLHGNGH